jgi:branched-chain amino acid transport system substrate-binding protein
MFRSGLRASIVAAGLVALCPLLSSPVLAQSTIYIPAVLELSGAGAVPGTNFRDGMLLAIEEINAKGGVLGRKIETRFKYVCDHNGIKGYTAVYMIKHVTEKMGKFDSKLFAKTLHGLTISPNDEPGILMEATFDEHGDVDRESFLGEVVNGNQKIVEVLPKLGK